MGVSSDDMRSLLTDYGEESRNRAGQQPQRRTH
jgi:hypothetical protein